MCVNGPFDYSIIGINKHPNKYWTGSNPAAIVNPTNDAAKEYRDS